MIKKFKEYSLLLEVDEAKDPGLWDDLKKKGSEIKSGLKKLFKKEEDTEKEIPDETPKVETKGLKEYLKAIAFKESSSDPSKVNSLGYMGKYQFNSESLNDVLKVKSGETIENYTKRVQMFMPKGFGSVENFYNKSKKINKSLSEKDVKFFRTKFKSGGIKFWPEEKQDKAMIQLLKNNFDYLENYLGGITKYKDKVLKGIKLTIPGMLAGAHLVGPKAVRDFIKSGIIKADKNGTKITDYIKKFGDYKFYLP